MSNMADEGLSDEESRPARSLHADLFTSSTKTRISRLHGLHEKLVDDDTTSKDDQAHWLHYILSTYALYIDRGSRLAVQQCLEDLLSTEHQVQHIDILIPFLQRESAKPVVAPGSIFVLVEWCSVILQNIAKSSQLWKSHGLQLIAAQAKLLERCVAATGKASQAKSARVRTRASLRVLFRNKDIRQEAGDEIITALTAKAATAQSFNAVYLGILAGVCSRNNVMKEVVTKRTTDFYSFYTREILGSRVPLPEHIANGLYDFFQDFSTQEEIMNEIGPTLEKSLLRAPEVICSNIIPRLVAPLGHMDLSLLLKKHLLKPLLSNVKSSSATVRDGTVMAFHRVAQRCSDEQVLAEVIDEVLKNLKDAKSADHRNLYAQMLASLKTFTGSIKKIPNEVSTLASKEANDSALSSETKTVAEQLAYAFANDIAVDPAVFTAFSNGLADKKPSNRRLWAMRLGECIWPLSSDQVKQPSVQKFVETTIDKLVAAFEEATSNAVSAAQTGLITVAYVVTALASSKLVGLENPKVVTALKKASVAKSIQGSDGKPSFLFNHRVYTKLNQEEDIIWLLRALSVASESLSDVDITSHINRGWSLALLYILISTRTKTVRAEAVALLRRAYSTRPLTVSKTIVDGLWQWLKQVDLEEKDGAATSAKAGKSSMYLAVRALCAAPGDATVAGEGFDVDAAHSLLVDLIVLCRPSLISRIEWIELCLQMGVDPRKLVVTHRDRCLEEIRRCTQARSNVYEKNVHRAACDAAAELAFVAREELTPDLVAIISQSLDPTALDSIGPNEAGIFHTPEGVAFVDVLSQKKQEQIVDKKAKDYDTLKWEQELRESLAKKQGAQKKLSADEQAKVKAQLEKEAKIRQDVAKIEVQLRRGIGIIESLANGPPNDVEHWIGPAINSLLAVIDNGAPMLVGVSAAMAVLECAQKVSDRPGMLRQFIGVAILRAQGSSNLPPELEEEDVGDLVTRVLYRVRFSGEQRPFDLVSVSYILPLLCIVLEKGGVGKPAGEEADEQITLALEFLSFHMDLFASRQLPRERVSALLLSSMQRFNQHYKLLKECILGVCNAIAPDATTGEVAAFLRGSIAPQSSVRSCALQAIDTELELQENTFCVEMWLASHDDDENNREIAKTIWEENSLLTTPDSAFEIIPYLQAVDPALRRAAARSLAADLESQGAVFGNVLNALEELYKEKAKLKLPELDGYGMPKKIDSTDPWEARHGIALAFREMTPVFDEVLLVPFVQFLLASGPLADKDSRVRDQMVDAATSIISACGASHLEDLLSIFEKTLEAPDSGSKDFDLVNEAVIIMYGALGRHLKTGDERIPKVVSRLLSTLSTPSETVQAAIADCLPPLIQSSGPEVSDYVHRMTNELLTAKKYASRRGAAYGLAGVVRGKGIVVLRENRLLSTLKAASEEKKDQNKRQGAFLAFELLSLILGPVFEPYVIQIVPQLLVGFGDSSADVREACLDAAKTGFASLSSFGVKLVLPMLLEGLNEQQWRSKKGACDSLGAMAYLDPQQLAISLPEIIPPLTSVLNDSHKEVRSAANRSLQRFGDVISNPEIKSLVGVLLKALSDPTKFTDEALDSLLNVNFAHYIDAPSLALVVRILERGLGDRSATKRKSAQIIGSLAHLTDRKDLVSNLPILVSGLRVAAVDPVPTTRATSSKALGSLVEKLGEDALPDLIPSLMSALKADTGAGDRLGSAQALSEVLAGLGTSRLEETLPSILQNVSSAKAAVREGFMSLFIFLPACFGNSFANYLSRIIPPILAGLADEVESIRETSLRAGRLLVKNFASRAIDLLLPELQRGLADDNYRIRLSSVELVGDLLFNLTGISTEKAEAEDDVVESAAEAGQSLLDVLGEERRNNVLSALYISRCDTSGLVKAAAITVWKALVATPRTLREITPTLTQVIIRRLASSKMEQKVIASNALGELIRKAGEGVLSSLLPTLEEGLQISVDKDAKQGICIALRELITSAAPDSLEVHEAKLIAIVRTALVDADVDVRDSAAEAFDSMQRLFGKKVVDQILPHLLGLLREDDEADNALAALLTLLTDHTRSNIILPNLLPTLLASPISAFNARALASLASVAGSAMTRRLSNVLNSLMEDIVTCKDQERLDALNAAFDAVLLCVDEFDGLNTAMSIMLGMVKNPDHRKRASANAHLATFFAQFEDDYSRYYADLIRVLLISFDDSDPEVLKAAWQALSTLTGHLRKEDMESLVVSTRQVLSQVGVAGYPLPGFSLPKGINAILPIFLQGLINGTQDQRTQAALAINEIIDKTSGDSLKPFVTQITGPLIRVVSDRSVDVKAAILLTLNNLLEKIPTFLKPFLPQLQRTFTKALADPASDLLRSRAAKALGTFITMTPRIDPLIGELVTGSNTSDPGVKNAMQKALFEVVSKVGANMSETSRNSVLSLLDDDSNEANETMAITNARLLGALIKNLSPDVAASLIKSRVLTTHFSRSSVLALNAILLDSPGTLTEAFGPETVATICRGITVSTQSIIAENCILAGGKYLLTPASNKSYDATKPLFEALAAAITSPGNVVTPGQVPVASSSIDSRRLALVVLRTVARVHNELARPHTAILAPAMFANVRDPIIPIKLTAEAAFLTLFCVVDEESAVFDKYMASANGGAALPPNTKRSMQDYFRRVALRLGNQARERKEAEGGEGALGLSSDEMEDERELWSVGRLEVGESVAF